MKFIDDEESSMRQNFIILCLGIFTFLLIGGCWYLTRDTFEPAGFISAFDTSYFQVNSSPNVSTPEWPKHWNLILKHSEVLKLVILDSAALKCIFGESREKQKGCQGLEAAGFSRMGTRISDFQKLMDIINTTVASDSSDASFTVEAALPGAAPDTIILKYSSPLNFDKFISISVLEFPPRNGKNYYLLRGSDLAATIAVRTFQTSLYSLDENNTRILVPDDVNRYIFFYDRGQFFECNRTLADRIPRDQKYKLSSKTVETLTELTDNILLTGQMPFMAFGTLLGWYRDCGFIPATADIDFIVKSDEYIDGFENMFIGHPRTPLYRRIGKKEYGFELSFWLKHSFTDKTSIDIFYLYEYNATASWTPLLTNFRKLLKAKCIIPKIDKLCSGELYGNLYLIPCNFMSFIESYYGPTWSQSLPGQGYFDGAQMNYRDGDWNANYSEIVQTY